MLAVVQVLLRLLMRALGFLERHEVSGHVPTEDAPELRPPQVGGPPNQHPVLVQLGPPPDDLPSSEARNS